MEKREEKKCTKQTPICVRVKEKRPITKNIIIMQLEEHICLK